MKVENFKISCKICNNLNLLNSFSRLYAAGGKPNISKLYRSISYPVGRGTPMLNSKIGWDHSQKWVLPSLVGGN
jgi:hypothetical protein